MGLAERVPVRSQPHYGSGAAVSAFEMPAQQGDTADAPQSLSYAISRYPPTVLKP